MRHHLCRCGAICWPATAGELTLQTSSNTEKKKTQHSWPLWVFVSIDSLYITSSVFLGAHEEIESQRIRFFKRIFRDAKSARRRAHLSLSLSLSLSLHYMRDGRRRQGKNIVVDGIDQDPSCESDWGRRSWWRIDWFWVETFHFSVSFLLWISDTTMVILFKSCCGARCFLLLFWSFSRQHSHTYAALAHLTVSTSSSFLSHCFRFRRKVSRTVDSKGPFAHGDGERGYRHRESYPVSCAVFNFEVRIGKS